MCRELRILFYDKTPTKVRRIVQILSCAKNGKLSCAIASLNNIATGCPQNKRFTFSADRPGIAAYDDANGVAMGGEILFAYIRPMMCPTRVRGTSAAVRVHRPGCKFGQERLTRRGELFTTLYAGGYILSV